MLLRMVLECKPPLCSDGRELLGWLGDRDRQGVAELQSLLGDSQPFIELPLLPEEPTDLEALTRLGREISERLDDPGM